MIDSMLIWFARHGESTGGKEGRYGGAADFPLSVEGHKQATVLREQAICANLTLVLTSPLLRARQTAEVVVGGRQDSSMVVVNELEEWNSYGVLSGLHPDEATRLFPDIMRQTNGHPEDSIEHILGAESLLAFRSRVRRAFERSVRVIMGLPTRHALIIMHGKFLQEFVTSVGCVPWVVSYKPAELCLLRYRPAKRMLTGVPQLTTMVMEHMTDKMKIYLVRHGEAQDDIDSTYGGVADHRLTPRGEGQARKVAELLVGHGISRIYTSPLRRAARTAKIIEKTLDEPQIILRVVDGLRERNSYGVLSGIRKDEACELFPLILKPGETRSGYDKTPLLGSEDFESLLVRVGDTFKEIVDDALRDELSSIVLVSHGTFLKALVTEYLGLKLPDGWEHGSAILLEYQPAVASITST